MNQHFQLSYEFRTWIQGLLAAFSGELLPGGAMVSADRLRVICSEAPLHYQDQPCRKCAKKDPCPLPAWLVEPLTSGAPGALAVACPVTSDTPAYWLVGLHPPPSELAALATSHLNALARFLHRTWTQWQAGENLLKQTSKALGLADAICKLGCRGASEADVARELDGSLRDACEVRDWALVSKEHSTLFTLVPERGAISGQAMTSLVSAMGASKELRLGDLLLLKSHPELLEAITAFASPGVGAEYLGNAILLPLLKPDAGGEDPTARMRLLVVVFPIDFHPPGPTLDLIRLLSQLALTAWESARRLAEAQETASAVQEKLRALPGFNMLVGQSAVMEDLRSAILRAAKSDRTVLLVGEQGTGKEMAAKLIHRHSDQGDFRFICRRVAVEMANGFELWKSFHPAARRLDEIVAKEFRDVPSVRAADFSKDYAGWKPKDQELVQAIEAEESRLLPQHRYLYRCLLRRLYQAWQQDVFFNFFEYDSGAAATQQIATELFGFPDKRFTDAEGGPGRFQTASHCGGTLFLDNIHHLDPAVQKALLKATEVRHEDRRVSRAGAAGAEPVHVRIIAATTTDLRELAAEKKFLYELTSRLMCEVIPIPPLNNRREDIPLLAAHFAQGRGKTLELGAVEPLRTVDWHGMNVRGLQNIIESAPQTDEPMITAKEISRAIALRCSQVIKEPLNNEQVMIREAMERAGGNIQQAAKAIGWSRQKLYRLLDHYGFDRTDFLRAPKATARDASRMVRL